MFRYLPEQASEVAPQVDWVNNLITDLSVFFTVAIVGAMIYFAIKYRRRDGKNHETPQIRGSHALEAVWTTVPTVISVLIAYYGITVYNEMRAIPRDALTINVWAQKWQWDFTYDNGKKVVGKYPEFVVPVDRSVKLVMQSRDVLHSFFIPAMRVKKDVIPGQYTYLVFKPIKTGTYHVFCAEYCGKDHSDMMASVRVVAPAEYERWVQDRSEEIALAKLGPLEKGTALYTQKGCNACHSLDGSRIVGPSFLKIWSNPVVHADGSSATVDENYVKTSVLEPNKDIVQGFQPNLMPSFAGQLSDDDIDGIIAFIKSIDGSQRVKVSAAPKKDDPEAWAKLSPLERGKKLYEEKTAPACKTCHTIDGTPLVGPTLKGIFGHEVKLSDGQTVMVDDQYVKNSILNAQAQVVAGFQPSMPNYQALLSEQDVKDLTEFIKSVK